MTSLGKGLKVKREGAKKMSNISKVLVIGSGPIIIGQAAKFPPKNIRL